MTIICKPSSDIAPQVHIEKLYVPTSGTNVPGIFRNAQINTATGITRKNFYLVLEDFSQTLTITNSSGNSDITDYPIIRRNGDFQGTDTVLLQRGDYIRQLNLDYITDTDDDVKSSIGIAPGSNYLRYSTEWVASIINGNSSVYSGTSLNPSCWLAGEDLTGIPYSNTDGGQNGGQKNSGMITPRHLPGIENSKMSVGTVLTFSDGSTRTIIGVSNPYYSLGGDGLMYVLNANVSAGTKVYPVPGRWLFVTSELGNYFTIVNQHVGVRIGQDRNAFFTRVCDYSSSPNGKNSGPGFTDCIVSFMANSIKLDDNSIGFLPDQLIPEFTALGNFAHARAGDSGSAVFYKVASGLALAGIFHIDVGSIGGGPFMDEDFANALIVSANNNAVANGHARPPDYTVTVAPDPTA